MMMMVKMPLEPLLDFMCLRREVYHTSSQIKRRTTSEWKGQTILGGKE